MDREFWRGKRVFLTGHTGFKGSWLSLWLNAMGAEVNGYSLEPPSEPNLFSQARIAELVVDQRDDVCDLDTLSISMIKARPDVVIHMAAQALVRPSYDDPVGTYATNIMGTAHVLEAVRHTESARVALIVTTDKCYENDERELGFREEEPMGGHDPYSSSKGCAELVTAAYRRSFFGDASVLVASARAGNVIGGGDWAKDRLTPDIIAALLEGRRPFIRHPHATRPWQHVMEPLSGYLALCQRLWNDGAAFAESWNIGPVDEDSRPVSWVADRLCSLWGDGAAWDTEAHPQPHEATFLKLDISKARDRMGWRPTWNLETALEKVVDWHQRHAEGADPRELTLEHIADYCGWPSEMGADSADI